MTPPFHAGDTLPQRGTPPVAVGPRSSRPRIKASAVTAGAFVILSLDTRQGHLRCAAILAPGAPRGARCRRSARRVRRAGGGNVPMDVGLRPGAKASEAPPMPYRPRASPRLYNPAPAGSAAPPPPARSPPSVESSGPAPPLDPPRVALNAPHQVLGDVRRAQSAFERPDQTEPLHHQRLLEALPDGRRRAGVVALQRPSQPLQHPRRPVRRIELPASTSAARSLSSCTRRTGVTPARKPSPFAGALPPGGGRRPRGAVAPAVAPPPSAVRNLGRGGIAGRGAEIEDLVTPAPGPRPGAPSGAPPGSGSTAPSTTCPSSAGLHVPPSRTPRPAPTATPSGARA